ncbi:MAG: GNAT family N-acetyltransferase [Acholeplasmataceae bacterium]|nr:GNAT family N-acetyltransferase [Acholeplasmataceae bacterium]
MIVYRKGKIGENDEIVKTINAGFSDVRDNLNFQLTMPKVYKKEGLEHHTLVCVDKDDFLGAVTVWPTHFKVLNQTLDMAYIGSVAVKIEHRGQGIMKKMMDLVLSEIKENNYDLAILSGQRQRYEYFGFYQFGFLYEFVFNKQNVKHTVKDDKNYSFREILNEDDEDLTNIYDLYIKRLFVARPKNNFYDYLKSRGLKVFVILKDDKFIGYYLIKNEEVIHELELINLNEVNLVLKGILEFHNILEVGIITLPFEVNKFRVLNTVTESFKIYTKDLARIYNFETTFEKLMKLSNQVDKLEEGVLLIEVEEYGTLKFVVDSSIKVIKTNEKANIKLTKREMTALTTAHSNLVLKYKNWFPLLVSVPYADSF